MATVSLNASTREKAGKGAARKVRKAGDIPAVVYREGADALHITLDPDALELAFRRTGNRNTLVELELAEGKRTCLVRDVQRHPVSRRILHVDFYEVHPSDTVTVVVPVRTKGTAAGVKAGGKLRVIRRDLDVRCAPGDIPDAVAVDVTKLGQGDFIRVSQVAVPKGCEIVFTNDFNVVTVVGKRGVDAAQEAEEAPAAPAEDAQAPA